MSMKGFRGGRGNSREGMELQNYQRPPKPKSFFAPANGLPWRFVRRNPEKNFESNRECLVDLTRAKWDRANEKVCAVNYQTRIAGRAASDSRGKDLLCQRSAGGGGGRPGWRQEMRERGAGTSDGQSLGEGKKLLTRKSLRKGRPKKREKN